MVVAGFVMDDDTAVPHTWVATADRKTAYETSRPDLQFRPHYGYVMPLEAYEAYDTGQNEWVYVYKPPAMAFGPHGTYRPSTMTVSRAQYVGIS